VVEGRRDKRDLVAKAQGSKWVNKAKYSPLVRFGFLDLKKREASLKEIALEKEMIGN